MPFELKNAPAIYCRLVNEVFCEIFRKFDLVFSNDIVVYTGSPEQHLNHLQRVL